LDLKGFTLTKSGNSQFSLVATNVTAGDIVVAASTGQPVRNMLSLETTASLPALNKPDNSPSTVTMNDNTNLQLNQLTGNTITRPFVFNGDVLVSNGNAALSTFGAPIQLNAGSILRAGATQGGGNNPIGLSGVISGPGQLIKEGTNTLTLSAANTYTGNTTVNSGTLTLGINSAVSSSSNLVIGGGTLGITGTSQTMNQLNVSAIGSHIDLGVTGSSTLHLSPSGNSVWNTSTSTALLTIDNWNANTHLFVGSSLYSVGSTTMGLSTTQLQRIQFTGHPLGATLISGGELAPQDVGGAISGFPKGDFDLNHSVDLGDIQAMLTALTDLPRFETTNHLFDSDVAFLGDFDNSGTVANRDIQGLLDFVASQGGSSVAAVPEPATLMLLILAAAGLGLGRGRPRRKYQQLINA
jgi:autotransporter-associated beta strand protein